MIKIGVVGVGHLGQHHARKFQNMEHACLVGIYDKDAKRAAEISQKLGTRSFASYEEMLDSCDAIDIAAPREMHAPLVRLAAAKRLPVLCQKPLARCARSPLFAREEGAFVRPAPSRHGRRTIRSLRKRSTDRCPPAFHTSSTATRRALRRAPSLW